MDFQETKIILYETSITRFTWVLKQKIKEQSQKRTIFSRKLYYCFDNNLMCDPPIVHWYVSDLRYFSCDLQLFLCELPRTKIPHYIKTIMCSIVVITMLNMIYKILQIIGNTSNMLFIFILPPVRRWLLLRTRFMSYRYLFCSWLLFCYYF